MFIYFHENKNAYFSVMLVKLTDFSRVTAPRTEQLIKEPMSMDVTEEIRINIAPMDCQKSTRNKTF
jgi:hypothetical protein